MSSRRPNSEFPEHAEENRRIWDANAEWWDDRIGDGNDHQEVLIEPATERLLEVSVGDVVLDIACGAGRFARRMAELGVNVVAFDHSSKFIKRARERTFSDASIEFHLLDGSQPDALLELGEGRFDKAVCTMGLTDMPEIDSLMSTLPRVLKSGVSLSFRRPVPAFIPQ